jgi:Flp pilus assembly protein TadG
MRIYSSSDLLSSGTAAHRRRAQRGASLVEYAFVVILFLSLLFGISGFGHALFVYHHLNNAAKEATRYAAVRGYKCNLTPIGQPSCTTTNSASGIAGPTTADDVTRYVASITPQSIDSSKFTVTVCGVKGSTACTSSGPAVCTTDLVDGNTPPVVVQTAQPNYPGCTVSVQVQYAYHFVFPLIATTPVNMSSTSEMIIVH